jgi:O-antigen ligase
MAIETFEKMQGLAVKTGGAFTALFILGIYFSTSISVIVSVILGVLWLFSAQFKGLPNVLKRYPVAAWSLALFVCFIIGASYGSATSKEAVSLVKKYRELIFIPVLIPFLQIRPYRDWVWKVFILASLLTLLGSYLMGTGLLGADNQHDPSFKSRITHSIFIAFFAFFCLHKFYDDMRANKLYLALFGLCVADLFFIVQGRTGQMIIIALILLFTLQRLSVKKSLFTALIIALLLTLFVTFSDKASRIFEAVNETQNYLDSEPDKGGSSMGQRYSFWENSLKLIAEKPLIGYGTGSFSKEYQRIAHGEKITTHNPHNEFLMIIIQLGLLGLLVYLGFLGSQYYCAKALPNPEKWLAQGILLCLLITSCFNTPFLDHTEGHWFATVIALCFSALPDNSPYHA